MDKVKITLDLVKKYHFWLLCVLAVVVGMLCWTWATADLANRFERRKSELEGHFTAVRQIPGNPGLRNEKSVEATREEHRQQKNQVLDGWKVLYQQQKQNNPLPAVLGEDFRLHFESLKPGQEMRDRFRERYLNFIERHYPALLRLVDIRRPSDVPLDQYTRELRGGRTTERRGRGGGASFYGEDMGTRRPSATRPGRPGDSAVEPDPWRGLVEWSRPEIFNITAEWEKTPTTRQVLLAQEDLWVYEALLRIISNVNEGVESHEKAWIKRIDSLDIGRPAAEAWVSLQQPIFTEPRVAADAATADTFGMGGAAAGGPGMEMDAGMGMMGGMDDMAAEYGGRSGTGRRGAAGLMDGRYVDENGFPLSAQQFAAQPPYAEFKMMMVRMDLFMHQRRIPRLLVECANSAMPIEVVRVRINPGQGGPSQLGGLGGARGGFRQSRPGPARSTGPRVIREGGVGGTQTGHEEDHDYANVEVFGIIYIYNPPDLAKLGTGAAATERPEEPAPMEPAEPPPAEQPPAEPQVLPPTEEPPAVDEPPAQPQPAPAQAPEPAAAVGPAPEDPDN